MNILEVKAPKKFEEVNFMEIKRNGINPSTWKKEVECPYCNALLAISAKDISIRCEPRINFLCTKKIDRLFIVKCKECNSNIRLKRRELPSIIIDYLDDHRDPNQLLEDFFICYFS